MTGKRILIVGASRGIGLGLTQELAGRGWHVLATQRSASAPLEQAAAESGGQIEILQADVTDAASIDALVAAIPEGSLDVVLVNAGVTGAQKPVVDASAQDVLDIMLSNTVGPVRSGTLLLSRLRDGGTLAFTTSRLGSIAESGGGYDLYRMSKAGLNILARGLFEQSAKQRGIAVLSLHPGWVQTDMGGPQAPLTVAESTSGLADVLEQERAPVHLFLAYDGSEIPW